MLLSEGESPPPLLNCVCVAVEILDVVEEEAAAAVGCSPTPLSPSLLLLPLHETEEVAVVAEAVVLLLNDVVAVLEAELLVQLLVTPTP